MHTKLSTRIDSSNPHNDLVPILYTKNLKLREAKQLAQGRTARKLGSWDANPGQLEFGAQPPASTPLGLTQVAGEQ